MDAERGSGLKVLLNIHSFFSFGAGVSSPRRLVEIAAQQGFTHLALTDEPGVYGSVELHQAAKDHNITPIIGATLPVSWLEESHPLVLYAHSRSAYARLNALITRVNDGETITLETVARAKLIALTGGRRGRFGQHLEREEVSGARAWLETLRDHFGRYLFVQLFHDQHHGDARRVRIAHALALEVGFKPVAAPEIRYASEDGWIVHDAMTCARLGINLDEPHASRPVNAGQAIQSPEHYASRFPFPDALENAAWLAEKLSFELLPDRLTPPSVPVPDGYTASSWLRKRCLEGVTRLYPAGGRNAALKRLKYELEVIEGFELENFFLSVAEITDHCRERGILAFGRGSAAGSVTCYALGVTGVDPIKHDLLFERFLHGGKRVMPDVDIDISSARRREVIAWVEERFGTDAKEAMVANRITYRLPSAVKDVARALGIPPGQATALSKAFGRDYRALRPYRARDAMVVFDEILGDAPVKNTLLDVLERMERGFVRHVAPHAGGVILSSESLFHYSPLETSTGGIRLLGFDKDDTEALGLIKYDLLGIRMLSAIENAIEEIERMDGLRVDVRALPDHPKVWWRIGRGDTLGMFQLESPGQIALSAQNKPKNMTQLAHQVALFRPGPIQSGTVGPYKHRKSGREAITYAHPSLEPMLENTFGTVLFQEQVLRICHHFAGLDWLTADKYRKNLSRWETEDDLTNLRERFVTGAAETVGASREQAITVFDQLSAFRGYGFAESHAFAFAQHAYASAWLREFYPAEYFCGLFNEEPGMYNRQTLVQEAIKQGVRLLPLDINKSGARFACERTQDNKKAVRFGLNGVTGLKRGDDTTEGQAKSTLARIALERLRGDFSSIEDFYARVRVNRDELEALAKAGAFDAMMPRREAIYQARVLENALRPGEAALFAPGVTSPAFDLPSDEEILQMDLETKAASESGLHVMDVHRYALEGLGVTPIAACAPRTRVLTAGLVAQKQRPPTANGVAFWWLEDGFHRVQVVISAELWEANRVLLRDSSVMIVEGEFSRNGEHRGLKAEALWGFTKRNRAPARVTMVTA